MTVFSPAKPSPSPAPAPSHATRPLFTGRMEPHSAAATGNSDAASSPRYWPTWAMLTVFIFISFECILLAAAMKGSWFILLAPGVVCGVKAWDAWKQLKRAGME